MKNNIKNKNTSWGYLFYYYNKRKTPIKDIYILILFF